MIRVGTSGFSFPDWSGSVYPRKMAPGDALVYYEKELGFNSVEINFTYYSLPRLKTMESLVKRTSDSFDFVIKGNRGMTHDPFEYRASKRIPVESAYEIFRKFMQSLAPMRSAGKLAAILLQFPVYFVYSDNNRDYILRARELAEDIPLAVEFRHRSWAVKETFGFLEENRIAYCCVDEPPLDRLMPFLSEVTSGMAYVRFHGRNKRWFKTPVSERYNYLYSDEELKGILPQIKGMSSRSSKTYLFFNNCHKGSAARNAVRIKELLGIAGKKGPVLPPIEQSGDQGDLL